MTISVKQNDSYAAATGVWVKVNSVWKQVASDGLEGLGGWAKITAVSGSPKRHAYKADGTDWVTFEWTAGGSFTIAAEEGLVEFLLVASASRHSGSSGGKGGAVLGGLEMIEAGETTTVTVGRTTDTSIGEGNGSTPSSLTHADGEVLWAGDLGGWASPYAAGNGGIQNGTGVYNSIFGSKRGFGGGAQVNGYPYGVSPAVPNSGAASTDGSQTWPSGETQNQGVVGIRVPAAQAAGVSAGSWVTRVDYYAEVTDGIVTDLYEERFYGDDSVRTENGSYASPEQPDDLIPCDPGVAEGWTYADGEFTPPPPDPSWREEAIEALKQQLKDLQKET